MFMTVMSLAISLVSIPSFYSLPQQENGSNQTPQSNRVQQENKDSTHPTVLLNVPLTISVKPIGLPPGDNAWAVQIVSRGGFTGSGRGDLTVTSEGVLTWIGSDASCNKKLAEDEMQALTKTILAANDPATRGSASFTSLCADCYVTTMVLQRRGTGGVVSAAAVSWDDASQPKLSAEMMTIYDAITAHKGCKL